MSTASLQESFFARWVKILFGLNQKAPSWLSLVLSLVYSVIFGLLWHYTFPAIIPRMENILLELWHVITQDGALYELGQSLKLVGKGMVLSVIVAFSISFSGKVWNFMRPIAAVMPKLRFWSTLGFAPILRILLGSSGDSFQVALLMFGIVPFLSTGFNSVFMGVEKDKLYDYARTMGFPEWKCIYYVMIRNRLGRLYIEIKTNFAIAWIMIPTVEVANRDAGGIGAKIFDYTRFMPGQQGDPYAGSVALNFLVLGAGILADYLITKAYYAIPEERAKAKSKA